MSTSSRVHHRSARSATGGPLRVAVVHDYLSQRGGAERVTLSIMRAFPGARLITSVYEPDRTFSEFAQFDVETSWLNRFAAFRRDPRRALPLLARTFNGIEIKDVDVVVCSSTGWAHGVNAPGIPKLVYCHSPARWLYESDDYFAGLPKGAGALARLALGPLHRWDTKAAKTVDRYLVNSSVVQRRLMRAYDRTAPVVWPPVSLPGVEGEAVPGIEPGFLLVVSRRRGYKHVNIVCEAVEQLPGERLVVVGGLPERGDGAQWSPRSVGLTDLTDQQLRWMYANCKALVATSFEDFGLTPVEAYSAGRPAVVLRRGGYLDSTVEGRTGVFCEEPTTEAVIEALHKFNAETFDRDYIREHAARFSEARFIARLRHEVEDLVAASRRPRSAPHTPSQQAHVSLEPSVVDFGLRARAS